MADPILESSLKTWLNTIYCNIFCCQIKKVGKFQLWLKTGASLFPFSCVTIFIILSVLITSLHHYTKCHYSVHLHIECLFNGCHYTICCTERHYTEWRFAERRYTMCIRCHIHIRSYKVSYIPTLSVKILLFYSVSLH